MKLHITIHTRIGKKIIAKKKEIGGTWEEQLCEAYHIKREAIEERIYGKLTSSASRKPAIR